MSRKIGKGGGQGLVPKLRFPEFREAGEWEQRTLSEVLNEHGQKSTGAEQVFSVSVHKGLINQIEHLGRSFSASSTDHYNRVLPGDVVYTKSPTGNFPLGIVKQSKLDVPVIVSPLYGVFSPETSALGTMLDAYFESPENAHNYLEPLVQKGAKNTININNKKFLSGSLILPLNHNEQQKIADCLSSLDELIILEAQQLAALKTHKKGLMQQLFPAEGETLPKLRFPEFQNAGEWEERRLGDACEKIMDGTHFSPKSKSGSRMYLTSKNIQNGIINLSNISFISDEEHRQIFERCPVKKNDVLLTKDGANTGNCALNNLDVEFSLLSSVAVLRGNPLYLDQTFLYQVVLADRTQKVIRESMSGQAITRITLEKIGNFPIPITSICEQQKIATCLASLDDHITAQTQKLTALKTHKKGLMQQLFPEMEQV